MIAFDNLNGGSVNLQPIYNSLAYHQQEIEELSTGGGGAVLYTDSTYNFNCSTQNFTLDFSNGGYMCYSGNFGFSSQTQDLTTSFFMSLNGLPTQSFVKNSLTNNKYYNTLYVGGINMLSNTLINMIEDGYFSASYFKRNSIAFNSGTYRLCNFKFEKCNVRENSFQNIAMINAENANSCLLNSMTNIGCLNVNCVSEVVNSISDISLYNVRNASHFRANTITNFRCVDAQCYNRLSGNKFSVGDCCYLRDGEDGNDNTFISVKYVDINNVSKLWWAHVTDCETVNLNCINNLYKGTYSVKNLNINLKNDSEGILNSLLFNSSGMNISFNNGDSDKCLRLINEQFTNVNTYHLQQLPLKNLQISYAPALEIVEKNKMDVSYSTHNKTYNHQGSPYTVNVAYVTETDAIYDSELNFKPTDRDEEKVVVKELNLVPYIRDAVKTPDELQFIYKYTYSDTLTRLDYVGAPRATEVAPSGGTDRTTNCCIAPFYDDNFNCVALCITGTTDDAFPTNWDTYQPNFTESIALGATKWFKLNMSTAESGHFATLNHDLTIKLLGINGAVSKSVNKLLNGEANNSDFNGRWFVWLFAKNPTITTYTDSEGNILMHSGADKTQFKGNINHIANKILNGVFSSNNINYMSDTNFRLTDDVINKTIHASTFVFTI